METKVTFNNSKKDKLIGVFDLVSEDKSLPIFIIAHGFGSNKESSSKRTADKLNSNGYNAFRFDFWAHGESDGSFEDITITEAVDDILKAIDYLKSQGYTRIGLVGNSFGGIASIMAASQTNDLYLLILRSPVSHYVEKKKANEPEELAEWKRNGFMIYENAKGVKSRLNYGFMEDAENNDGYKVAPNIKVPTLIIHGDKDESVPVEQSKKISKLIPDCRLEIIKNGDHRYTGPGDFEKAMNFIVDFIKENFNN